MGWEVSSGGASAIIHHRKAYDTYISEKYDRKKFGVAKGMKN